MSRFLLALCVLVASSVSLAVEPAGSPSAGLLEAAGVKAGLCVQMGAQDAALAVEVGRTGRFLVHGLAADDAAAAALRKEVQAAGLYGPVSIERGSFDRLPYAPDIVNLLIVDAAARSVDAREVARVLAPDGVVAFQGAAPDGVPGCRPLKSAGGWTLLVKPRPEGMDDFTHYNYDATCNRVSRDRLAEVPHSLRWLDGPDWTTAYSGPYSMVSAGGRIFTGVGETYRFGSGNPLGNRVFVTARDAYNGKVLWKKPAPGFETLAAIATTDVFYTRLQPKGPLVALDALTGRELRTYQDAGPVDWAVLVGDKLVMGTGGGGTIKCVGASTAKVLWKSERQVRDCGKTPNVAVNAGKGEIYFAQFSRNKGANPVPPTIGCLNLADGAEKWSVQADGFPADRKGGGLASYSPEHGIIVLGTGDAVTGGGAFAYSTADGHRLWTADYRLVTSGRSMRWKGSSYIDGYFIDGLFWILAGRGNQPTAELAKAAGPRGAIGWHGHDPKTGQVVKRLDMEKGEFINDSCHRTNCSVRYFLGGHADFVDRSTGRLVERTRGLHNGCHFGMIPANGLWYTSSLYLDQFVQGEAGMAGLRADKGDAADAPGRLETGPGKPAGPPAAAVDWPGFRSNPMREGVSGAKLADKPEQLWAVKLSNSIGQPTAAAGKVFVADLDGLRVVALDAADGKVLWSRTVGGRVHVPPTYHDGMVLFGCGDGWVYALSAQTGELIWRYRAAPASDRIIVRERLESPWPVLTGVLVVDGVALAAAGRYGTLDGGIEVYALEPATGKLLWHKHSDMESPLRLAVSDGRSYCLSEKESFAAGNGERGARIKAAPDAYDWDNIDAISRLGGKGPAGKVSAEADIRAVARTGDRIVTAGPPPSLLAKSRREGMIVNYPENDPELAQGELCIFSADGSKLHTVKLNALPVFDGLCAAGDKAFLATQDGTIRSFGAREKGQR